MEFDQKSFKKYTISNISDLKELNHLLNKKLNTSEKANKNQTFHLILSCETKSKASQRLKSLQINHNVKKY